MRNLLLALLCVMGLTAQAQIDVYSSVGVISAQEFIGNDIKNGVGYEFGAELDVFPKSKLNFGPTTSVQWLGKLTTDIDEIEESNLFTVGAFVGFDAGRFSFKTKGSVPLTEKIKEHALFKAISTQSIEFRPKKDGPFAIRLGFDYYFNRFLFHYTHKTSIGITFKY